MEAVPEEEDDERPLAEIAAAGRQVARQCTVLIHDEATGHPLPDPQYPAGIFEVPGAGDDDPVLCAVISVMDVEGRLLVAVPHKAWNRTTKHRILPPGALRKTMVVEVPFESRSTSFDPGRRKIWLGLLAPEFERYINFETPFEMSTLDFPFAAEGPFVLPVADALADYAIQFTPFESAVSSAGVGGATDMEKRLKLLEQSMAEISDHLKNLTPQSSPSTTRPSALRATPKPASKDSRELQSAPLASRVEGFDLEVVRSAREAGVPESQIAQMMDLANKGRPRIGDVPPPRKKVSVLSDSEAEEEEEADEEEEGALSSGNSKVLVSAVSKLTKIASQLAARRKKDRSLEGVLDGVGSGASESSGLTGTRRHAAALRALRAALHKQPEELYRVLEANLERDFNILNQVPGSASVQVTARAWLEMRSHVQSFQTPVRLLWAAAGALDCMRQQKYAEARARLCLMLAAGDQLSIDRGNWLVASEMLLEEGPPMATFAQHSLPQDHEAPFTNLVDGRWVDLFVAKLKDYEELAEKKRKLTTRKTSPPLPEPAPKVAPKVKAKGKGKGGGGNQGAEDPPVQQ